MTDEEKLVMDQVPADGSWRMYQQVVDGSGLGKKARGVIAMLVVSELEFRNDGTWDWLRRRPAKPSLGEV